MADDPFRPILALAAKQLGIDCPALDAMGVGGITGEDGYEISIIAPPFDPFAYLAAPICFLEGTEEKALSRRALECNYMLTRTRGATLAIDPDANQLILCAGLRLASLSAEVLAEEIASMGEVARDLREQFLAPPDSAEPSGTEETVPGVIRV